MSYTQLKLMRQILSATEQNSAVQENTVPFISRRRVRDNPFPQDYSEHIFYPSCESKCKL